MARPGRPERNRAARSFRELRRFHRVINSNKVFGTHTGRIWHIGQSVIGRVQRYPRHAPVRIGRYVVKVSRTVAKRREGAKSKIDPAILTTGACTSKSALRRGQEREYQINRLIVL